MMVNKMVLDNFIYWYVFILLVQFNDGGKLQSCSRSEKCPISTNGQANPYICHIKHIFTCILTYMILMLHISNAPQLQTQNVAVQKDSIPWPISGRLGTMALCIRTYNAVLATLLRPSLEESAPVPRTTPSLTIGDILSFHRQHNQLSSESINYRNYSQTGHNKNGQHFNPYLI